MFIAKIKFKFLFIILFISIFALCFLCSCSSCSQSNAEQKLSQYEKNKHAFYKSEYDLIKLHAQKKDTAIKNFINSLSVKQKIAQIFLINLESDTKFIPVEWITENNIKKTLIPAGYIFFGYNISRDPKTVMNFTNSVTEHAKSQNTIPPFLSIDVEGGVVNRLRSIAGPLPENERVSSILSTKEAATLYDLYAKQLKLLGFNLNLSPVAEICNDNNKDFLSGRSYGDEKLVKEFSSLCVTQYQNNKVASVIKHFPGNTNVDPHVGLPKLELTNEEFNSIIETFSHVIESKPEGVLLSHAIVSNYDKTPSCLSKFWINEILRNKIEFDGIIFSDDIFMNALIKNGYSPKVASVMAIDSGVNCIMISEKKFGRYLEILYNECLENKNFLSKIDESVYKMLKFKLKYNIINCVYNKTRDEYVVDFGSANSREGGEIERSDDEINDANRESVEFSKVEHLDNAERELALAEKQELLGISGLDNAVHEFLSNKLKLEDFYKTHFINSATNDEIKALYMENK